MRNFDRNIGYKNSSSSSYSRTDRRDYYDDKYRSSSSKGFGRNDYKKPRRDYEDRHSYQATDRGNRSYDDRYRSSDQHSRNERSFRGHSPKRSRDRDGGHHYRSNEIRSHRNMSPPASRRNDYKSTNNMRIRMAPIRSRLQNTASSRLGRVGGGKILRRNDMRSSGLVSKRSATINRAKDYARKIRQARMKLNEGGSTSESRRLKSTIEAKSPKKDSVDRKADENEDDYFEIANDVNFDEDENESMGGKKEADTKVKEEMGEEGNSKENNDDDKSEHKEGTKHEEKDKLSRKKKSASRSPSKERPKKFDRIEYSCIHCGKGSTSAQEYRSHLSSRRHLLAMREVGLRVRATLNRLRKVQRDRQLEIEARIKDVEDIESKYCQVCKLNFRQSKEEHRESEDHKKINSFLKPYCKICRMKLVSPMKYEIHRCHTDHIRRKLKAQEGSDEEIDIQEMDIGDFKTVDSVGNVDEDEQTNEDDNQADSDDLLGLECIKKVQASFCSLCNDFIYNYKSTDNDEEEKLIKSHCKSRRHINRYRDNKKDEERRAKLKAQSEKDKSPEKSIKQEDEGAEKVIKKENEDIDENTNEESKRSDDES